MEPRGSARVLRWASALAVAAAWAGAVPYLAGAVGLRLDVPARLEVVDHVLPAAVALVAAAALARAARGRRPPAPGDTRWLAAAAAAFLCGFWVAATHVPLLAEAVDGIAPRDAALLHSGAALPLLAVAGAMLVAPLLGRDG